MSDGGAPVGAPVGAQGGAPGGAPGGAQGETQGGTQGGAQGTAQEGQWIRQASPQEAAFHSYACEGMQIISYVVRLATCSQLETAHVQTALSRLYRKVPNLRIVFEKRGDGELWLKDTLRELDFQVVENADIKKWHMRMSRRTFQADGPLWAARFLPWSPSHAAWVAATEMEDVDGTVPDVPHLSHVILSFHHGITDGYSCIRIISHFLKLLDTFLSGKSIADDEQIAEIIDIDENNRVKAEVKAVFRSDKNFLEERIRLLENSSMETLLQKAFPVKPGGPEEMDSLVRIVDRATHTRFLSRCKAEGVTFHSAFCTMINAAIAKLVAEHAGDELIISSSHAVNCRRYYTGKSKTAYGLGMRVFRIAVNVPRDVMADFWTKARRCQEHLQYAHSIKAGFEAEVMGMITGRNSFPLVSNTTGPELPKMKYFTTTNMLDVTPFLGDIGKNVRLEFYDGVTSMHKFPELMSSGFQTFRGQLLHSLVYNVHLLGHEAARKLSDTIFDMYAEVSLAEVQLCHHA